MKEFAVPNVGGPCPRCGFTTMESGWVRDSHSHRLSFEVEPRSEGEKISGDGRGLIYGRVCRGCNYLELFVHGIEFDQS